MLFLNEQHLGYFVQVGQVLLQVSFKLLAVVGACEASTEIFLQHSRRRTLLLVPLESLFLLMQFLQIILLFVLVVALEVEKVVHSAVQIYL